jgi:tRNA-Thr(GGU) m(6)t(6)A37 methyltransferase TsaA
MELKTIGRIHTGMNEKFGLPRQSGLAMGLKGSIVFEKDYALPEAFDGLQEFEYIWILWGFDEVIEKGEETYRPKVRPPRLGGNEYKGVFATRSPYRPNPIGLSCVKLEGIEITQDGPVVHVSGIDMRNGTPVYDIKPYLPYAEAHPGARGGFTDETKGRHLEVFFGDDMILPESFLKDDLVTVKEIISQDPRPAYHDDPARVYGMNYKDYNIRFKVSDDKAEIISISSLNDGQK